MPKKTSPSLKPLVSEWNAIRLEWLAIKRRYRDDNPDWGILDDEELWKHATTLDLCLKPEFAPDFPKAYWEAVQAADDLLCGRYARWAYQVVNRIGKRRFPLSCVGPRRPKNRRDVYESPVLARILAGTPDVIAAGKRIIFWGAVYAQPMEFHRELGHRQEYQEWVKYLLVFGGHWWKTLEEPMAWVADAFELLCQGSGTTDKQGLAPAQKRAFDQWLYAERAFKGESLTDAEAYGQLKRLYQQRPDEMRERFGGCKLPSLETWARYVRSGRNLAEKQKHKSREGRHTASKSIVPRSEL